MNMTRIWFDFEKEQFGKSTFDFQLNLVIQVRKSYLYGRIRLQEVIRSTLKDIGPRYDLTELLSPPLFILLLFFQVKISHSLTCMANLYAYLYELLVWQILCLENAPMDLIFTYHQATYKLCCLHYLRP